MNNWINIEKQCPPHRTRVLTLVEQRLYNGKIRMNPTIAEFIPPKTVKSEDFLSDEFDSIKYALEEYEEETDTYWVLENWFESPIEGEVMWVINEPVKYWTHIPSWEGIKNNAN